MVSRDFSSRAMREASRCGFSAITSTNSPTGSPASSTAPNPRRVSALEWHIAAFRSTYWRQHLTAHGPASELLLSFQTQYRLPERFDEILAEAADYARLVQTQASKIGGVNECRSVRVQLGNEGIGLAFQDVQRELLRLRHDLIHIVVLIGRQAAGKMNSSLLRGERLITGVQLCIFRSGDGIVRISIRGRIFIDQCSLCVVLPREMLELRHAGVWIFIRIVDDGYRLVLMSSAGGAERLSQELGAIGLTGSVTEPDDLGRLVDAALEQFGRIDAVVNNTGHPPKGELLEVEDAHWHHGLDLVLLNVIRMARLVTPAMQSQGGGAIVNISTFSAFEPSLSFPVSSTLRAGLGAFAKLYSDRYGPDGIRMNNVLPGFMDSYPESAETIARIPAGRYGSVDELAATVSFLLSPSAAYITGQSLRVDGGLTRSV